MIPVVGGGGVRTDDGLAGRQARQPGSWTAGRPASLLASRTAGQPDVPDITAPESGNSPDTRVTGCSRSMRAASEIHGNPGNRRKSNRFLWVGGGGTRTDDGPASRPARQPDSWTAASQPGSRTARRPASRPAGRPASQPADPPDGQTDGHSDSRTTGQLERQAAGWPADNRTGKFLLWAGAGFEPTARSGNWQAGDRTTELEPIPGWEPVRA